MMQANRNSSSQDVCLIVRNTFLHAIEDINVDRLTRRSSAPAVCMEAYCLEVGQCISTATRFNVSDCEQRLHSRSFGNASLTYDGRSARGFHESYRSGSSSASTQDSASIDESSYFSASFHENKKKNRPCKGKRDRRKKFLEYLYRAIEEDPEGFDIAGIAWLPSFMENDAARKRILKDLQLRKAKAVYARLGSISAKGVW